jgi:starch-binding outer membrane protein, SusD/RagB family
LCYLHALDLYGNTTFTTEVDKVGAFLPKRGTRAELYAYVETECKALESLLPEPRTNEYGRADKAAVWMILANLYLNAQVYTGTAKYGDALIYAKKVIDQTGYALQADYRHLFLADNHRSNEFIFAVAFDGVRSRTWGGTTYLVHAPVGGDMNPVDFGIDGGWGGLRTTSALVNKFPDPTGLTDRRAQFQLGGQTLDISNVSEFRNGYSIRKWKNVTSTGTPGSNVTWVDTDFPIFRLAEANLIYAEAHLRGGGGTLAEATTLVNALRTRAYGNTSANFSTITLQNVLDERARELHWEAKRRTDLIRYNQFTTADYLWPLKGGSPAGIAVAPHLSIYPIPAAEINTNSNLTQNTGYPR